MIRKWILCFAAFTSLCSLQATASEDWRRGSVGNWEGDLYYVDYQSGKRFGIPMSQTVRATPDGHTLIRETTWTDPGRLVHAVSLMTIDADTGELIESFYREGSAETFRYQIKESHFESMDQWQLVYQNEGLENGQPALIIQTVTRSKGQITTEKKVRVVGEEAFIMRNSSSMKLVNVGSE